MDRRHAVEVQQPEPLPMERALAVPGEVLPWVLLFDPRDEGAWAIGHWSNSDWFGDDGLPLTPTAWAPLPAKPKF